MNKVTKEEAKDHLSDLLYRNSDIKGALIATSDGIVFTQVNLADTAGRLGAMAAAALGLGKQLITTTKSGDLDEITVSGGEGLIFIYSISHTAVMITVTKAKPNVAMAHWEAKKTISQFTNR